MRVLQAVRQLWGRRQETLTWLRLLGTALPVTSGELKKYPTPSITGYYYAYPIVLECVRKGSTVVWRIHSELTKPIHGRMALHGEGRHGKMRELYGMEVILPGDELFDTRIVLAGTQETKVRHALTPYICQRFLGLPLQVFMIDCRDHEVYF